MRFLVLTNRTEESLSQFKDLRELLTDTILEYAPEAGRFDRLQQGQRFSVIFGVSIAP